MENTEKIEENSQPVFRKFLGFLIYLPNVMPLKALFSAEIFPWAFLYSVRRNLQLPGFYKILLFYLFASSSVLFINGSNPLVPLRSLFALINATMIFFVLISIDNNEYNFLIKLFHRVFIANVVLCFVQFLGLFPPFLEPVFRLFIDRFTHEIYGGGRGVAGLFAEPSYASMAMHYYFAFFMFYHRINPRSFIGLLLILSMIFFDLFIIRSVTGIVMIVIYIASLQKLKDLLVFGVLIILVLGVLIVNFGNSDNAPRSLVTIYDFIKYGGYQDPVPWLLEQSGFRFVSIWAAYKYGLNHLFGSGLGGWGQASIDAMDDIGIKASAMSFFATAMGSEYQGVRPTSFGAGLMLETGLVGFCLFILTIFKYLWKKWMYVDLHARSITLFFIFNTFALGSIGDPVPFIFFALTYRAMRTENEPISENELTTC